MKKDLKNVSITFALIAAAFFGGAALNSRSVLAQNASGSSDTQATEAAALKLKEQRIAEINAQQELLLKEQSGSAASPVNVTSVKAKTTVASSQKTASQSASSQNVTPVVDAQAAARLKAQQDYIVKLQQAQQLADQQAAQLLAQQQAAQIAAQSMMYSRSRMSSAS